MPMASKINLTAHTASTAYLPAATCSQRRKKNLCDLNINRDSFASQLILLNNSTNNAYSMQNLTQKKTAKLAPLNVIMK